MVEQELFWLRHLSYQIYGYYFCFSDDRYPQITSMRKLDDDFSLFPHLKALFRLHPRLSWECLHYLEADTPQTLLEAKKYFAAPAYLAFFTTGESESNSDRPGIPHYVWTVHVTESADVREHVQ